MEGMEERGGIGRGVREGGEGGRGVETTGRRHTVGTVEVSGSRIVPI